MKKQRKFSSKKIFLTPEINLIDDEHFEEIYDYPKYWVSNRGYILNTQTKRILKPGYSKIGGWALVNLTDRGSQKTFNLASLVAEAFLPTPVDPNTSLLHVDADRTNNAASNLVWKPRWFVVKYIKEMSRPYPWRPTTFKTEDTNLIFHSHAEFAMYDLTLPSSIQRALGGLTTTYFGIHGRLIRL